MSHTLHQMNNRGRQEQYTQVKVTPRGGCQGHSGSSSPWVKVTVTAHQPSAAWRGHTCQRGGGNRGMDRRTFCVIQMPLNWSPP